jgi:hypothetical protein
LSLPKTGVDFTLEKPGRVMVHGGSLP